MLVEITKEGNVAIISMEGNMMGTCDAEELHTEVISLLGKNISKIVLNMAEVHWIGSLCIGAVMREVISARQKEGDICLASPSKKVKRLFQITKLESVVKIYASVDEAVNSFRSI